LHRNLVEFRPAHPNHPRGHQVDADDRDHLGDHRIGEEREGLRSRFSKTINFPDYATSDMVEIFRKLATDAGYKLTDEPGAKLQPAMDMRWSARDHSFANARDVRTMLERAISNQASRVCLRRDISDADLTTLLPEHIPA
jgi:hypothetical protein